MAAGQAVIPVNPDRRPGVKAWLTGNALPRWRGLVTKARQPWVRRSVPGITGALGFSVAVGGIADYVWGGLGAWIGLLVASVFLLRLDSRI